MKRRGTAGGFALLEILFMILILGAAAVVAARLLALTARAYREAAAATNDLRSQQQWLRTLRDDAWAATDVTAEDAPAATFALADAPVRWTWAEGRLTRAAGDDARHWRVARAMRWRLDGRSLVVVGDVEVPLATPSLREAR